MLAKHGLTVVRSRIYNKVHDIEDWIGRTDLTQTEQDALYDAFARAPQRAKKHFQIVFGEDGRAVSFTDDKVILKAIKKASV